MKITDIKQQVKRPDRYSIYIDGKYSFPLGASELLNLRLHINQEYTRTELENLKQKSVLDKAFDQALNLIMRRPRSEWEILEYLKRKEYDSTMSGSVLDMLRERGYVDDADFARRWVDNRRLLKSTSKRRLQQELRAKRVSDDVITQVLADDETDEQQVLRDLIARKRQQTRYQDDIKLTQYLIRQGYNYQDIKAVITDTNP